MFWKRKDPKIEIKFIQSLRPGDTAILECPYRLSSKQAEHIKKEFAKFNKDKKIQFVILDGGIKLSRILRSESVENKNGTS